MTLKTFDIKFPCTTQLTFGSLTFATEKDGDLKMLPPGSALEHLTLTLSSASVGSSSGSDPCAGSYICTTKIVRDISIDDIHPPTLDRDIKLIIIGIDP
jgi:hypothetical protein